MKVISEKVAVLALFDLWIFLRGMRKNSLFCEGGKKKWALSGEEGELCQYFWSFSVRGGVKVKLPHP